ncbi:hypothetical protein AgCh_015808 [Apium graveolens]
MDFLNFYVPKIISLQNSQASYSWSFWVFSDKIELGLHSKSLLIEQIEYSGFKLISNGKEFDSLFNFLDELSDLARFRSLELNMQSCVLSHPADMSKVSDVEFRPGNIYFLESKKKIQATCRLVGTGSIPLTHIGSLKASMLNTRSQEVAAPLQHADGSTKRQWVLDAAEISCMLFWLC